MQAVALQTMLDKRLNGVRLDFGSRIRGSESGPPGWAEPLWNKKFRAPYVAHRVRRTPDGQVHVATQAGVPDAAIWLDFSSPAQRTEYLRDPDRLVQRCRALRKSRTRASVVVDEA
jgi:hypothetical protein